MANKRAADLESKLKQLQNTLIKLNEEKERSEGRLQAINAFIRALNEADELEELLEVILQGTIEIIPNADSGTFLLLNEPKTAFEFKSAIGWDLEGLRQVLIPRDRSILAMLGHNEPTIISGEEIKALDEQHQDVEMAEMFKGIGYPKSSIIIPVTIDGEELGYFNINSTTTPNAFDEEDLERMTEVIDQISLAVKKVKTQEELREAAIRDPLTGSYNRRYFTEILNKELERSKRYHHPFSLLMLDIDRFKEINDRFGHVKGDEILCEVARMLEENVREVDVVVRYGGDEFLVLMPETQEPDAQDVVTRLNERLKEWNYEQGLFGMQLTLSTGIYTYTEGDVTQEDVLRKVDARMYREKLRE
ncbi:MAG: diguanylate cyclase [Candidatus Bipolaricaulia bacterium]